MPAPSLEQVLQKHRPDFHQVVPFDSSVDKIIRLNLQKDNKDLNASTFGNLDLFMQWIDNKRTSAGARYGIGGYGEHRGMYATSVVFDAGNNEEEPRRLHVGLDIWGNAGTVVMAPLSGVVHSFAINDSAGDYGGTIILKHDLDGIPFYSLYGHLSHQSVRTLQKGQAVRKGEAFASLGIPAENGQWPPHLHFQLIKDIGEADGDYPGVCKFSERAKWLANCPDPELVVSFI